MQEQANEKTVGLVCRTTRMIATMFARLCGRYLRYALIEGTTTTKSTSQDPFWLDAERLLYNALIGYIIPYLPYCLDN